MHFHGLSGKLLVRAAGVQRTLINVNAKLGLIDHIGKSGADKPTWWRQ
jgi:hypothetical protein